MNLKPNKYRFNHSQITIIIIILSWTTYVLLLWPPSFWERIWHTIRTLVRRVGVRFYFQYLLLQRCFLLIVFYDVHGQDDGELYLYTVTTIKIILILLTKLLIRYAWFDIYAAIIRMTYFLQTFFHQTHWLIIFNFSMSLW